MAINWTNEKRKLSDLIPQPDNPRKIQAAEAKQLIKSRQIFNQVELIAIGPDNQLYNGHQRLKVWGQQYGYDLEVDVRVSSRPLTHLEWQQLTTYLHRGTVGEWDFGLLEDWGIEEKLIDWGFSPEELQWFKDTDNNEGKDTEPQEELADGLLNKWEVKPGQVWSAGQHRIACIDSTDTDSVARLFNGHTASLVVTDPPYGVDYAAKNEFLNLFDKGNRIQSNIKNGNVTEENIKEVWFLSFSTAYGIMNDGACFYCFMPQGGDQMMMMMKAGIEPRHELIWLKNNHVLCRVDYAYKHEPILYAWKEGRHKFYGDFQTSILEFNRPNKSELHPTMKPVPLIERLIKNSSLKGEIVYDMFLGSGTTLIAADNLDRVCYGCEIEPKYVAVILQRYTDHTGKEPVLLSS